jgi:hypothetical protein
MLLSLRRHAWRILAVGCFCAACSTVQTPPPSPPSYEECKAQYSYNAPDRYIYPPLPPSGITGYPRDIPDSLIPPMSTEGLLESCLANPHAGSSMMFRKSLAQGRAGIFTLNTWQALESRTDAYRVMIARYDRLEAACIATVQSFPPPGTSDEARSIQSHLSLIELALTRESFLNRLSLPEKRQLAAKVVAKHRQKMLYNFSNISIIGTGDGLWLLSLLMLSTNDAEFSAAVQSDSRWGLRGLVQGDLGTAIVSPSSEVEAIVLRNAERFASGR